MPAAPVGLHPAAGHGVEPMTQCQVCGAEIRDDMKFCVQCTIDRAHSQALKKNPAANSDGENLAEVAVCSACGERLKPDLDKCEKCGAGRQDYAKVLKWYQKTAKDGDDCAQERLAEFYLKGIGTDRNYKKALEWYSRSAEQGNDTSKAQLGYMVEQGLGVERDLQKALALYRESAETGNALGQVRLGDMVWNGSGVARDPQKACQCFQKSAEQDNDLAQLRLGMMYCAGNGVEKDLKKGFKWVQKSAEQGNTEAQLLLGGMYKDGKGVPQDHKKAFVWIHKLAVQGNLGAQNDLGCLYERGWGVDRDLQKAREWYLKAAGKGLDAAQVNLANLYRSGLGVEENIAEAKKWYVKAAEQGNEKAKSALAQIKLEADPERKLKNKIAAALKGDAKAMAEVAAMYRLGIGAEKSEENALEWFKKAFEFGNVSVRGELKKVQQAIDARRKAESRPLEKKGQKAVPAQGVQKKKPPAARTLVFPFSLMVLIGLLLAVIFSSHNKKPLSPDEQSPAPVPEMAEAPPPETEAVAPAIAEAAPETTGETKKIKSIVRQSEKKSLKIAGAGRAAVKTAPAAAGLRREYKFLNEQDISEMLGAKNLFDAQRNPGGTFGHQYEIRNVAGVRLIFDRATKLVWLRQANLVKMNLKKAEDWIASLSAAGYGGIGSWRLPTVEEAASLLKKNPANEKAFLDAVFGVDIRSIWTGDGLTESRSWIIDFRNGLIDYAKNKSRLPALMVSSDFEDNGDAPRAHPDKGM
jgi:TPR repeat protein